MSDDLTHLDAAGRARMVQVAGKDATRREAIATAVLRMTPETASVLAQGRLPKGDALAVARVAGIMAAKRTPELIPLCHPIALTAVAVDVEVDSVAGTATITATTTTTDRTGVEMEAMTAASVAALTLYDMVKGIERGAVIEHVRVESKSGGSSGDWSRT